MTLMHDRPHSIVIHQTVVINKMGIKRTVVTISNISDPSPNRNLMALKA